MKRFGQVLSPILFSLVLVFSLSGIAHGSSMWTCSDGQLPLVAQGIDAGFKCLCIVKTAYGSAADYFGICGKVDYYKEWMVEGATFAGFGCKGYCVKSPEWKQTIQETNEILGSCDEKLIEARVRYKRLSTCNNMMWTWDKWDEITK